MIKDTLRNEITEIVAECCVDLNVPEATSQILSLLEGRLEKEPSNKDSIYYSEDNDAEFYVGWNACLQEIKEKLK